MVLLAAALQPLGHGCPLLRAARAWPWDVLLGAVASLPTLRRRFPALVRIAHRYYLPLRLLGDVRVGRAALPFPTGLPFAAGASEVSRFSCREFPDVHGFSDRAGFSRRWRKRDG